MHACTYPHTCQRLSQGAIPLMQRALKNPGEAEVMVATVREEKLHRGGNQPGVAKASLSEEEPEDQSLGPNAVLYEVWTHRQVTFPFVIFFPHLLVRILINPAWLL